MNLLETPVITPREGRLVSFDKLEKPAKPSIEERRRKSRQYYEKMTPHQRDLKRNRDSMSRLRKQIEHCEMRRRNLLEKMEKLEAEARELRELGS